MRLPLRGRSALFIFIATTVFTFGSTGVAVARVFHCASGDVFCLIASIRSANERVGDRDRKDQWPDGTKCVHSCCHRVSAVIAAPQD